MLNYLLRRFLYSILIIAGVVLLTFVLFRLAAGDPAAAVLGKNPSPQEVEDLRSDLGADLPLFYGSWRKTEAFSSADFSVQSQPPGIKFSPEPRFKNGALSLNGGKIEFRRNFDIGNFPRQGRIKFKGQGRIGGRDYESSDWKNLSVDIPADAKSLLISDSGSLQLAAAGFFRKQESPFNSQLFRSVREIISFKSAFPFVSFLNFGRTIITREPIRRILWRGVGPSLCLMLPIFLGEILLGIALALTATAFKGRWPDRFLMLLAIAGMSISYLVFIIAGQWFLAYTLNWFPVWGWGSPLNLALPVIIGIASGLGGSVRFYRTVFVNELNREYLRTAAAKGCSDFTIYTRHLLRNAAIPIITHATAALPFLFTGSLLLETFFGIPGLGYLGVEALNNSDLQLLKALVIISAILFVTMNTLADIAYAWADPRIRLK
ncbi:MAG: ABC transporter permease [Victivallaceae bacterium]|nr:ABC transporter permease [Victivallaceae bacterium]